MIRSKKQAIEFIDEAILLQGQIEKLSEQYKAMKVEIQDYMRKGENKLEGLLGKAAFSVIDYETFDKALFKKRCPKIYQRYAGTDVKESFRLTAYKKALKGV